MKTTKGRREDRLLDPEWDTGPMAKAIAEGIREAGLDPDKLTIVIACPDASQVHDGGVAGTASVHVEVSGDAVITSVDTRVTGEENRDGV